jgi:hypothetical protein
MRAATDQSDGVSVEVCARAAAGEAVDTMRKKKYSTFDWFASFRRVRRW